jgi:hypothetical protein
MANRRERAIRTQLTDWANWGSNEAASLRVVLAASSDREGPLIAAEYVSDALARCLRATFERNKLDSDLQAQFLDNRMAPLESFYARSLACRAFMLIGEETYLGLGSLRAIRNHFGHWPGAVAYSDAEISKHVSGLEQFLSALQSRNPQGNLRGAMNEVWKPLCGDRFATLPSDRVTFMTAAMLLYIVVATNHVQISEGAGLVLL